MSDRRGPPPAPRMMPKIPIVPWSSAPPPVPPRTFSTEPPPESHGPPSEPTLVRQDPIDARALMMGDPQRAEEIRDEARSLVHQALEEAMAPLHFRIHELERRIETQERNARAAVPAPPPSAPSPLSPSVALRAAAPVAPLSPSVALRAVSPAAPPVAYAPTPQAPPVVYAPMAYPPLVPAPAPRAAMPLTANAVHVPADPFMSGAAAYPRPPAISSFDIDVPFDGARRQRKVLFFFGVMFVLVVAGLLGSMAMSYSSPH